MRALAETAPHPNPLWRSTTDRWIAGVCGGFAAWLGWRPATVRAVAVLGALVAAVIPGLVAYAVLWAVMPTRSRSG